MRKTLGECKCRGIVGRGSGGMEEFIQLFLHNCKIPCNFNLIHSSCHNYMMCVCLNIEAMQV